MLTRPGHVGSIHAECLNLYRMFHGGPINCIHIYTYILVLRLQLATSVFKPHLKPPISVQVEVENERKAESCRKRLGFLSNRRTFLAHAQQGSVLGFWHHSAVELHVGAQKLRAFVARVWTCQMTASALPAVRTTHGLGFGVALAC